MPYGNGHCMWMGCWVENLIGLVHPVVQNLTRDNDQGPGRCIRSFGQGSHSGESFQCLPKTHIVRENLSGRIGASQPIQALKLVVTRLKSQLQRDCCLRAVSLKDHEVGVSNLAVSKKVFWCILSNLSIARTLPMSAPTTGVVGGRPFKHLD